MMRIISTLAAFSLCAILVIGNPVNEQTGKEMARRDLPVLCTEEYDDTTSGLLYCVDSTGSTSSCEDCMNYGSVKNGYFCYITNGDPNSLVNLTTCPNDPPPAKNPDGTDAPSVASQLVTDYCSVAGTGGAFGWVSFAACFAWSFYSTGELSVYEQNLQGIERLCTCIDSGACGSSNGGAD